MDGVVVDDIVRDGKWLGEGLERVSDEDLQLGVAVCG